MFFFESESRAYNTTEFEAFNYTGALLNFVANDGYTTDNQSAFFHVTYDFTERLSGVGRRPVHGRGEDQHVRPWSGAQSFRRAAGLRRFASGLEGERRLPAQRHHFLYAQAATGFTSDAATPRIFTVGQLMALQGEDS